MTYLENFTFGTRAISVASLAKGAEVFAGQYASSTANTSTTATTALAIDMSKLDGNLKNRYTIRLNQVTEFAGTGITAVTFKFYYLNAANAANSAAYTTASFTVPVAELKKSVNTPIEFGLPSFGGYRFLRLGISTDATDALTAGAVIVAVEPTRL